MYQTQLSLFDTNICQSDVSIPIKYIPNFLSPLAADNLFLYCQQKLAWQHNKICIMKRWQPLPRLECMYGDAEVTYIYSKSVRLQLSNAKSKASQVISSTLLSAIFIEAVMII
jgi:hypothetical protein